LLFCESGNPPVAGLVQSGTCAELASQCWLIVTRGKSDSAKMAPKVGSSGPGSKTAPTLHSLVAAGSFTSMANASAPSMSLQNFSYMYRRRI
jgi:hypothetical protein